MMPVTPARHPYLHVDVFTSTPLEGNQLAVFRDGRPFDAATMQRVAREMAFSESTFLFPSADDGTDCRMRIFTPASELPMAGHPVIGSAFALARTDVLAAGRSRFVFGLEIGPTPVELEWRGQELAFAWMTQLPPTFGATIVDRAGIAAALSVPETDLIESPVQLVSCGVPFLFVPLRTRRAVDAAALDARLLARLHEQAGTPDRPVFLFSPEPAEPDVTVYSRMFGPQLGIPEDPATGSASGPLGCYLVQYGLVPREAEARIVSRQGVRMGRPSLIHAAIESSHGTITQVRVGGRSVIVGEGHLTL